MNRRSFVGRAAGVLSLLGVTPRLGSADSAAASFDSLFDSTASGDSATKGPLAGQTAPRVDGERLNRRLAELGQFGANPEGGVSRVAYGEADLAAREWVLGLMADAGLDAGIDGVGNLVGRKPGTVSGLRPISIGSHIDSVPGGGNYDGQVGSMGAVEVAQTLADAGHALRHPLEVLIFQNEEGGKTGSRAVVGVVQPRELDVVTASGMSTRDGIAAIGGDAGALDAVRRQPGDIAAFLELHIEQGAVLEREGVRIGVVEGIVGIRRWFVVVEGFANHAGTTPMNQRRDAMVTAARIIDHVNDVALTTPGSQVATVGRLEAEPGVPNVVPGRVTFTLEIRDLAMEKIASVFETIEAGAHEIAARNDTSVVFDEFYESRAAPTEERIRALIEESAEGLGLPHMRMPSGAGHDAQSMADIGPIGMIFVPSVDGISHSPRELSHPEDITAGADVLLHTILKIDARDWT